MFHDAPTGAKMWDRGITLQRMHWRTLQLPAMWLLILLLTLQSLFVACQGQFNLQMLVSIFLELVRNTWKVLTKEMMEFAS